MLLNFSLIRNSFSKIKCPILLNKSKNIVDFESFFSLNNRLKLNNFNKRFLTTVNSSPNSSSLENYLKSKIKMKGPITVAEFMKESLGNPKWGYYMKKDVFGKKGDFITAPEISQMFGEIVGIWFLNEWLILKELYGNDLPSCVQFIELGPGRGTLMSDMLRVWSQNKEPPKELTVYMVETSPFMRKAQMKNLCNLDFEPVLLEKYPSKHSKSINIAWLSDIDELPKKDAIHFFVANEFFDALPFQKFQKTEKAYREVLVDFNESKNKFEFVLSPKATIGSQMVLKLNPYHNNFEHVEVSAETARQMETISKKLLDYNGSILIMDYGHYGESKDTFRAFKDHKIVDVFENLGDCDLTYDVDFLFLRHIAQKCSTTCYGPVTQREFLSEMQIGARLQMLIKSCKNEEDKNKLINDFKYLLNNDKMGERFKVMAVRKFDLRHTPPGFLSLDVDEDDKKNKT